MIDYADIFFQSVTNAITMLNRAWPGLPWIIGSLLAGIIILGIAAGVRCGFTTQRGTPCTKGSYGLTCHHHRPYARFGPNAGKAGAFGALSVLAFAPAVGLTLEPLLSRLPLS